MTQWNPPREGEGVKISYILMVVIKMLEEVMAKVFDREKVLGRFSGLGGLDITAGYPLEASVRDADGVFTDRLRNVWVSFEALAGGGSYPVHAVLTVHQGRYFCLGFGWKPQSARIILKGGKEFPFIWKEGATQAEEDKSECEVHGSIEHMQSVTGKYPGCGKP